MANSVVIALRDNQTHHKLRLFPDQGIPDNQSRVPKSVIGFSPVKARKQNVYERQQITKGYYFADQREYVQTNGQYPLVAGLTIFYQLDFLFPSPGDVG